MVFLWYISYWLPFDFKLECKTKTIFLANVKSKYRVQSVHTVTGFICTGDLSKTTTSITTEWSPNKTNWFTESISTECIYSTCEIFGLLILGAGHYWDLRPSPLLYIVPQPQVLNRSDKSLKGEWNHFAGVCRPVWPGNWTVRKCHRLNSHLLPPLVSLWPQDWNPWVPSSCRQYWVPWRSCGRSHCPSCRSRRRPREGRGTPGGNEFSCALSFSLTERFSFLEMLFKKHWQALCQKIRKNMYFHLITITFLVSSSIVCEHGWKGSVRWLLYSYFYVFFYVYTLIFIFSIPPPPTAHLEVVHHRMCGGAGVHTVDHVVVVRVVHPE